MLHGHGLRERQQRGPLAPDEPPCTAVLRVRRYRCTACRALLTVVPQGLVSRRHYSGPAIGLALALFGAAKRPAPAVRARVSPWRVVGQAACAGWAALRRWIHAVRAGRLFAPVRAGAARTLRALAERAAATLAAGAPPAFRHRPFEQQVFAGATRMA